MKSSEFIGNDSQKEIIFQCPICKRHHKVAISLEELQKAKFQLKLVQKAYGHEDFGQVIILHIDWESRIRRVTAYNFLDNPKSALQEDKKYINSFTRKNLKQIKQKLPDSNELYKKMSLDLIKPWKTSRADNPTLSLDTLIKSMVKSSKNKKIL
ncbi:MAG: hypothetical protein HeimC3_06330 [Candidatus Heimdallarchaeota archaeon LC_3]|nr:MAG: hypothetical protein HeimC3_06330 [Candidatus Heimdallarchaeota archaeon LC_3]